MREALMLRSNVRRVCVAFLLVAQGPMSASFGMDSQPGAGRTHHHDYTDHTADFTAETCSTGIANNVTAAELTNGCVDETDRPPPQAPLW